MKENGWKALFSAALAAISGYLLGLAVPLILLFAVMIIDYATGMTKAFLNAELSSRTGWKGILKKLSYLGVVAVGMVCDYVIFSQPGIDAPEFHAVSLLILFWLIVNELLSILENLAAIGVPMPGFILRLVRKLKVAVESRGNGTSDDGKDGKEDGHTDDE